MENIYIYNTHNRLTQNTNIQTGKIRNTKKHKY